MIKNIVFDIGKVLVRFDWEDYLASFQFPEEETTAIAKAMFLSSNWNLVDEGRLSYEEIEQIFVDSCPAYADDIRLVFAHFGDCITRFPYTRHWISSLKQQGYQVYYLSNYGDFTCQCNQHHRTMFKFHWGIGMNDANMFPFHLFNFEGDMAAFLGDGKTAARIIYLGKFYDFYFVGEDRLAFLIADVSGKGIPAAMFMMTAKTLIKSLAESGLAADQVFTTANNKLCEGNDAGMFVTAWFGILDLKTGDLEYVNGGHNPPLLCRESGSFAYLESQVNFVLAGMEGIAYEKDKLMLQPGDKMFLYTDGVTEAMNKKGELYSEERLCRLLNAIKDADAELICKKVKEDVDRFVGDALQFDDITMLALCYQGSQE